MFRLNISLLRCLILWLGLVSWKPELFADISSFDKTFDLGFTPIAYVSPDNLKDYSIDSDDEKDVVASFCGKLSYHFEKYGWEKNPCDQVRWRASLKTKAGAPLIYAVFGEGPETTLIISSVHADENTPVPMGFRLAKHLMNHSEVYNNPNVRVVIAPIVNPDGFLKEKTTRQNSNGVDLNRNFFTIDWYRLAGEWWRKGSKRNPRYYPGYFPNSEIETIHQIELIDRFLPDKILSIHAPLGFLDYDGPGDDKMRQTSSTDIRAKRLVDMFSKKTQSYRVVDYSYFPGSLGNYAGNERNIPTVTLEFKTTSPKMVDAYWKQFLPGILELVKYRFRTERFRNRENATSFYGSYEEGSRKRTESCKQKPTTDKKHKI